MASVLVEPSKSSKRIDLIEHREKFFRHSTENIRGNDGLS